MKKALLTLVLCLSLFTAKSYAVSYYAAWNFLYHDQYVNLCPNLNSSNPDQITFIHIDPTLYQTSGYYVVVSFVMGYDLTNQHSGFINSREIGTVTDYLICTSNYVSSNAVNVRYFDGSYHVYAGRIYQWLIPENYFVVGNNPVVLNFKGQTVNFGITVSSSSSSAKSAPNEMKALELFEEDAESVSVQNYYDLRDTGIKISTPLISLDKNEPTEAVLE